MVPVVFSSSGGFTFPQHVPGPPSSYWYSQKPYAASSLKKPIQRRDLIYTSLEKAVLLPDPPRPPTPGPPPRPPPIPPRPPVPSPPPSPQQSSMTHDVIDVTQSLFTYVSRLAAVLAYRVIPTSLPHPPRPPSPGPRPGPIQPRPNVPTPPPSPRRYLKSIDSFTSVVTYDVNSGIGNADMENHHNKDIKGYSIDPQTKLSKTTLPVHSVVRYRSPMRLQLHQPDAINQSSTSKPCSVQPPGTQPLELRSAINKEATEQTL